MRRIGMRRAGRVGVLAGALGLLLVFGGGPGSAADGGETRRMLEERAQRDFIDTFLAQNPQAERAAVERTVVLDQPIQRLRETGHRDFADAFAGAWFDEDDGNRVKLGLAVPPEQAAAVASRLLDAAAFPRRDLVDVLPTDRTFEELSAMQRAISADMPELRAAGIEVVSVGLSTPDKGVLIGVVDLDDVDRNILENRYGADRITVEPSSPFQFVDR